MQKALKRFIAVLALREEAHRIHHINTGSAIVSRMTRDLLPVVDAEDRVDVWFEGNVNKVCNLVKLSQRIHCAAGRMMTDYPTTARESIPDRDLEVIAVWDCEKRIMAKVLEPDALLRIAPDAVEMLPAQPEDVQDATFDPETVVALNRNVFLAQNGLFLLKGELKPFHPSDARLPGLLSAAGIDETMIRLFLPRPTPPAENNPSEP